MKNKQEIIEYLKKENETFKLDKFILEDPKKKENGAIGIITSDQIILTHTLDNGCQYHNITYNVINKIIKDIPLVESDFDINSEENKEIKNLDNIFIRIFNEEVDQLLGIIKSVWIHLPKQVTENQLEFLKQLENEYGIVLKTISKKLTQNHEDALVGFKSLDGKTILDDSFSKVIAYIEKYLLVSETKKEKDKIILGRTLQDNQKHL